VSTPVITTTDLTKFYGKARGIEHVNLEINEGEIFGFIGPNGAGKSTTIRILMNMIFLQPAMQESWNGCYKETRRSRE